MQATYARQLFDSLSKLSKPHEVLSDRVEELFHLQFGGGSSSGAEKGQRQEISKAKEERQRPAEASQSSANSFLPPINQKADARGRGLTSAGALEPPSNAFSTAGHPFKPPADEDSGQQNDLSKFKLSSKQLINTRKLKEKLSRNSLAGIQSQAAGGAYSFKKAAAVRNSLHSFRRSTTRVQVPDFNTGQKAITPQNEDFLIACFEFFAKAKHEKADEYLKGVFFKAMNVISTYGVDGYQNLHPDQVRLSLFSRISGYLLQILDNSCISSVSHSVIIDFICNTSNNFSLSGLIRQAIDNKIDPDTELGHRQTALLVSQLPLIDKLQAYQRSQLLQLLLKKLANSSEDSELDLLHIFKMPNRQVLLLLLTHLIVRQDFKSISPGKTQQFLLTNSQIRDMMGICLKAVSHFFEERKNFESLIIYLKLAFKIFVCVGVEGSQTILGGRSLSEFIIYFLMKALDRDVPRLNANQFAIFINIYLDSISFLIRQSNQGDASQPPSHHESQDTQIIMEAFEIFALFTPQFNNLNKNLFEILNAQIDPSRSEDRVGNKDGKRAATVANPLATGVQTGNAVELKKLRLTFLNSQPQAPLSIDSSCLYRTIENLGIRDILMTSMHTLVNLELSSISSRSAQSRPAYSSSLTTEQSLGAAHDSAGQTIQNSVSLKFYSNMVRYTMDLNFEKTESKYQNKPQEMEKVEVNETKSCSQILSAIIELSKTVIYHLKQEQNPPFQLIRNNLQMIQQKFFQCLGVLDSEGKSTSNPELFSQGFQEYTDFVLYDISSVQIARKDQESQQFGELLQNFIIDPMIKALKKVRLMKLFAPCTQVLVRAAQKIKKANPAAGTDREAFWLLNEYENQYKLFWMILQIVSSQQSEMSQELLSEYLAQNNLLDAQLEVNQFARVLDCIYDIMVIMGAPQCFMDDGEKAGDHKNSQEIMYLWAHIMLFVQKGLDNSDKIAAQINKLASISSCLLFDQDFSMKMRVTSQKFKDIEDLIFEKRKHFEKYPQLLQSLDLTLSMRKERKDETQPKQANSSPSKSEIIKKVEKAKMRKNKLEEVQNQQEQVPKQEEKQDEDSINEEVDPQLASQQLNNNELLFIEMFILMSEARINFFKTSNQENNDAKTQNFVESMLIIFNNYQIDQDNLQQKLESIVKVMIVEYIETIKNFSHVNLKNTELKHVVSQDFQVLLKARIHLNKQMSHVAGLMLKKYVEVFPLILREFGVHQTLLDCIQILSQQLSREYESIVKPVCLKTLNEFVFLPADHERVKLMLTQMVALYSELLIYASIYDRNEIHQSILRYKSLIDSSLGESRDQSCEFQLQMYHQLQQSFNLNKMKLHSDKNLLELRSLFILDPPQAISEINKVKQLENGNSAFFFSQLGADIFQLGSLESINDSNISLSKISPFSIHNQELAVAQSQTASTVDFSKQALDQQVFDLQAQLLKHMMKIDMTSQIQYLQKSQPIELILKEITKEQLKVKELQMKRRQEQQLDMKRQLNSSMQANDSSLNIYVKSRMKSLQFMTKVLQVLNKEPYILKQCNKIASIVEHMTSLIGMPNKDASCHQLMRRHQVARFIIGALSICLEAPLVDTLHRFIQSSQSHDLCQIFSKNIDQFSELMISRIERKKSLKSQPKEVKQNVLTNQFGEQMNSVQQRNQIQGLFEIIDQYDFNILNIKSMHEIKEVDQFDESFAGLPNSEMDSQSRAMIKNSFEIMKFAGNYNQQCQATKVLKYFDKWLNLMMSLYNKQSAELHQHKLRLKIARSYRNFITKIQPIMFDLAHKKGFLKLCLSAIKFGLTMARFEGISEQGQNKPNQEERHCLLQVCFELLIKLIVKQKRIIMRRATLSKLKDELQLLEDIKYLINKVNVKNPLNPQQTPFTLRREVSFLELPQIKNAILLSAKDFAKLGIKRKFVRIKQLSGSLMIVTVKEKYSKILQQQTALELTFLNNLMTEQLNHLKYSLLGNNFYQKQMMDIHAKAYPLVTAQLIREKYESLLYTEPKLLALSMQAHESFKAVINSMLQAQFEESKNILQKVFWKSEHVLEILMKMAVEIKNINNANYIAAEPAYRKLISIWRNRHVSRMISFVGYKYSGQHFLHSVALKPFYASSSKITIFYLSQMFQSLRWDTNFQLHRLLIKKSQTMPSIAHNVIWFCRVEGFVDAQPQRKVPLPINENLDIQSNKLASLIFRKMSAVETEYFNTETNFLEKITSISGVLKPSQSKDEKKAIIREKLIQYNKEIPDNVYLPTNQKCRVVGIVTSSGQPMQSAARVPILVSFEVQEYEGPDSDPAINKGQQPVQVSENNSIIPSKQDSKLKTIFDSLSQSLLKINSISFDRSIGNLKIQEELRDQVLHQQLQNYQNINENLMEMLNEEYEFRQSMLDNQTEFNAMTFDYSKKFKTRSLFSDSHPKSSLQNHLAQIQKQPTLKIKMSQYSFQTKQNPLSVEDANPFAMRGIGTGEVANQGQGRKSTSIFAKSNQDSLLDLRKPTKFRASESSSIPGLKKSKLAKIEEANSNEMNDSLLSQSQQRQISEVSDSESIYDYGKRNSPYKSLMRKSSLKKRFKSSVHFQSISLNTNMRGFGQFLMKTGNSNCSTSSHHVSYKPSIFGSMHRIDNSVSNGINLVLQFEQQILESQQKKHHHLDGDSRTLNMQGNAQIQSNQRASIQKDGQDQSLVDSRQISQSQAALATQGPRKDVNKPTRIVSCIFKVNDDLRQDILALQFIKLFQKIFKKCDLDLFVAPYKCISNRTGTEQLLGGIIEVVPNSNSRDQIGKAFEIDLYDYFLKKYGNESSKAFQQARLNFIRSLAAYSVVSFILQIKDRHNGNILVDDQGSIVHIDFGFIFDWSPGKDMRFESANFKMTKEFIKILGGDEKAEPYQLFVQKTIQGYLAVREHHRDFMNLVELMIYSGFPCFKQISLQTLQQRFRMEGDQACANQFEAAIHMRSIIEDAHDKWTTTAYDMIQYKQNKIVF